MASFANTIRQLLGRGQDSSSSTPGSIARFDGMDDSHVYLQQMQQSTSPQEDNNSELATANGVTLLLPEQYEAAGRDHAYQPVAHDQHIQPIQQFALQEGEYGRNHMHRSMHSMQERERPNLGQYGESTRQLPPRTTTAQPSQAPSYLSHGDDHSHVEKFPDVASYTSAETQVKQELAVHEHDDHNLFAEFTNEDIHDNNARMNVENRQTFEPVDQTAFDASSIKPEPECENQLPVNVTRRAETFDSIITADRSTIETPTIMTEQKQEGSTVVTPQAAFESGVSESRVHSEPDYLQSHTSSRLLTHTNGSGQQYSFEQYAQSPPQSNSSSQAQPSNDKNFRSPYIDSVIDTRRHSSEETASSLGGMNISANARLLEQEWRERHKLPGMVPLTAEVGQANPILLHGPRPSQEQFGQRPSQPNLVNQVPPNHSTHVAQPTNGLQRRSTFPYHLNMQYLAYPAVAQYDQAHSHWIPHDSGFTPLMHQGLLPGFSSTQVPPPQGSTNSHRIAETQDDGVSAASDDEEPLATRAPRHRSTTASPMPPNVQEPIDSSSKLDPTTGASESNFLAIQQSSVIELSDDDDKTAETISWKLPDFEVTYHPPATDKDLPMAKVSILGRPKNLVRSEVALTEDHAHHEMELFLNVFLPVQQALQTPDSEPAHAVINFHTISVMVLEAFVQYEIGDEIGRGYGFHGGNVGNRALRPSPSSSDDEPTRTRSSKDADVDEIFFAVIDRWRAGLISGKGTLKLIRGCQEFCDIALDVIHYVKEHGLSQPEPKKRKERSDKGVKRGPKGAKETETKAKAPGKRKADPVEDKTLTKKYGKVNELHVRKKAKVEVKKKVKPKVKSPGVTVIKGNK